MIRKSIIGMALLFVVAGLSWGQTTSTMNSWTIDKNHSEIAFKVRHLGISNVTGQFFTYDTALDFDPNDLNTLEASMTVDVASLDSGVERRDNHLRSADFFDVEVYPQMTFVSKEVRNVNGNEFELVGDLTIKDVTREVVLEAELLGTTTNRNRELAAFEATAEIDRFDYNLRWDNLTEAGSLIAGRTVQIIINLEVNRQLNTDVSGQ